MRAQFGGHKFICIPRVLAIILALFLSLFAFDTGTQGASLVHNLTGVFIHLIPALMVVSALALSWKYPAVSGFLFLVLGIAFTVFFNTYRDHTAFLILSLPLLIIGILITAAHRLHLSDK